MLPAVSGTDKAHARLRSAHDNDRALRRSPASKKRLCAWTAVIFGAMNIQHPATANQLNDGKMDATQRPPMAAPARDGNIAIREEFEAARRANTVEAYDLFIARHPGHPLVPEAERERALLQRTKRQ